MIYFYMLLLSLITLILGESYYSIIAPGLIKSSRKYTVVVAVDDVENDCLIRITIESLSFNASQDVQLKAFEVKSIDFHPPKLYDGNYKLIAEGLKGLLFKNESSLIDENEWGPKIYIQTDKARYNPMDLVQFRIVILDEHTRPLKIQEPIRVDILDGDNNRIKQFKDIKLINGVYTGKFQISQRPVLGTWLIRVRISGKYDNSASKSIIVSKFVLPKFSVHIQTSRNLILRDELNKLKAIIYGKYTFGNYVEGNATVQLCNMENNILFQEQRIDVKNPTPIEFLVDNVQDMQHLEFKVYLTDRYSGTTENSEVFIYLHNHSFNIQIPEDGIEFRNNKPYLLKVYIEHWSGVPVLDNETPVILQNGINEYKVFLNDEGVATFEFDYDNKTTYKVVYKDSEMQPNLFVINARSDPSYCRLKLLTEKPRLGTPIELEVSSLDVIPYLVYIVVGHGSIIHKERIILPPQQKSYIIRITPSIEMVPESYVYAYFIHNGNLRSDEIKITLPNEFENRVSIKAPKQLQPGQQVSLDLIAQPGSYVSILAVDIAVYLLDPSYDLNRDLILYELRTDKSYTPREDDELPLGILSGLLVLSNAHYFVLKEKPDIKSNSGAVDNIMLRKKFPQTWIFENFFINSSNTQLTFNLPDTITTWRITAFSNNDITGFGIVDKPTDIISKKSFFISLNLPYSVKLGEIIIISAIIFNYLNQSINCAVTLFNNENEFNFQDIDIEENDNLKQIKYVNVSMNSGEVVKFIIKPLKVGKISICLTANNSLYSDAVLHKLKVEAGGISEKHNQAFYIKVAENETYSSNVSIHIPANAISNSEYITLRVGGDYLMPPIGNLDNLIEMPTGCGEQNMIHFAPSVLILQLLKATGKHLQYKELVSKVKSYIEIGYQQQLSFRHWSGGFSAFGQNSNEEESTWLTAYVIRFFIKASKYTAIEKRIINSGLEFLADQQYQDGSFPYTGYLFMPALDNEYAMTSFVLLTFLESIQYSRKYPTIIEKGVEYLNTNIDNIDDIYALAITATVLKCAKSSKFDKVIRKLLELSKGSKQEHMWWSADDESNEKDIEITAYILIALLDSSYDFKPILKWLISQRNEYGGFRSSQDTVVGLLALVKVVEILQNTNDINATISYIAKDQAGKELHKGEFMIDTDNRNDLQKQELPSSTRFVEYTVNGNGYTLVQLSYQYNIINDTQHENMLIEPRFLFTNFSKDQHYRQFVIEPNVSTLNPNILSLEICFIYQPFWTQPINRTNMVIMEINLPTGFRSDADRCMSPNDYELLERIESKYDDTLIILYFDCLIANSRECVNVDAEKINDVVEFQPVAIKMYDYYNSSRSETVFYNVEINK